MTTTTKLTYTKLTSIITDSFNPILNPNIIIVPEVTGESAYTIARTVLGKGFTFTTVGESGALLLTSTGKTFGYYSAIDNTLTIEGSSSASFEAIYPYSGSVSNTQALKADTDAIKADLAIFHANNLSTNTFKGATNNSFGGNVPNNASFGGNVDAAPQDAEMEAHYNKNYGTYNNTLVETDLNSDRSKFSGAFGVQSNTLQSNPQPQQKRVLTVDGACSGNPGKFEFQMVWEDTKERLNGKHYGDLIGTNNIAEFLGLSTAIHHVIKYNLFDTVEIHTDSVTALAWLRKGAHSCKSKGVSPEVFANLDNALNYINTNRTLVDRVVVVKHDTKANGEIAADFNRKK